VVGEWIAAVLRVFLRGVSEKVCVSGGVFVVLTWWNVSKRGVFAACFSGSKNTPRISNLFSSL
jgi:hypothetical protein